MLLIYKLALCALMLVMLIVTAYRMGRRRAPEIRYVVRTAPAPAPAATRSEPPPAPRPRFYRPNLSDPKVAIRYVERSQYNVRAIMNKEAYGVFKTTERYFRDLNLGYRVIPELCMGTALHCEDKEGYASIRSKRLDIAVIDWVGNLVLAIEYNGGGHYQGNASGRDAVKRLALNKAMVPLLELIPDDDESRILEKLKTVPLAQAYYRP